mmetsp:Transcript_26539/g.80057  ORF Transcript_26539/g.80057 Transcript_26539/m.80057 type:complete len:114 (+) Transcript_26539:97-438(+)
MGATRSWTVNFVRPRPAPGGGVTFAGHQRTLAPLPDLAINSTGSPVRLVGGLGMAIRDPLAVGRIDSYSASNRAIELARASLDMARDSSPERVTAPATLSPPRGRGGGAPQGW